MEINETLKDIVSEQTEKQEFKVDSMDKAEWAVNKIFQEKEQLERYVSTCEHMISAYNQKIEEATIQYKNKTSFLEYQLRDYLEADGSFKKISKTQESIKLPSAKLVLKYPKENIRKNDEELLNWLKTNNMTKYIKTKEEPAWAELKADVDIVSNTVVTKDGEVIEGLVVESGEPKFEIKF